jgi:small subunit ribosomal protein S6
MNFYEHTYITIPELTIQELDSIKNKINEILKKNDGQIIKEEDWGVRTLAYAINKNSKGKYNNLYIEGNNKIIKEIEQFERYEEKIIKFLSIKIKKVPEEISELAKVS